jgi:hypothetical protein
MDEITSLVAVRIVKCCCVSLSDDMASRLGEPSSDRAGLMTKIEREGSQYRYGLLVGSPSSSPIGLTPFI